MNIKFIAPASLVFFLIGIHSDINALLITNVVAIFILITLMLMSNQ